MLIRLGMVTLGLGVILLMMPADVSADDGYLAASQYDAGQKAKTMKRKAAKRAARERPRGGDVMERSQRGSKEWDPFDRKGSVRERPGDVMERRGSVRERPGDVMERRGSVRERPGDVMERPGDVMERQVM